MIRERCRLSPAYDAHGFDGDTTDPRGLVTRRTNDRMGRPQEE